MDYYIWSNEHRGWWGPGRCGYSPDLAMAGKYSRDAAISICRDAIPTSLYIGVPAELPVRVDDVKKFLEGQFIPAAFFGRR